MAIMFIVSIPHKWSRKCCNQIRTPVAHRHVDNWRKRVLKLSLGPVQECHSEVETKRHYRSVYLSNIRSVTRTAPLNSKS